VPQENGQGALELKADLIVTATHDRSRVDRLLGRNIATAVVRRTALPVLVIRPTDEWTSRATAFKRLLVCLDGSEGAEEVLPWARLLGRQFGSTITLLSVPEGEAEVPRLEHYLASVATALRDIGFTATTHVTGTNPVGTITRVAAEEDCDLIVIATRGRGAPQDIDVEVGSVTDRVIHSAHCPVFAVTVVGFNAASPGDGV
jgi:nucleotide-binding universal stress UspA family protein